MDGLAASSDLRRAVPVMAGDQGTPRLSDPEAACDSIAHSSCSSPPSPCPTMLQASLALG